MKPKPTQSAGREGEWRLRFLRICAGVFFGLALLKFGNAAIMEGQITWPESGYEWAINPWPVVVGYGLLVVLAILGISVCRWHLGRHRWLVALPLAWFGWQMLAATTTVDGTLTGLTLKHFAGALLCFYLGYFALGRMPSLGGFWAGIIGALLLVIANGAYQRFGGLEETRNFLLQHEQSHWRGLPEEQVLQMEQSGMLMRTPEGWTVNPGLLKKAESKRISSTLFYPNSLAGAILLVLPPCLVVLGATRWLTPAARGFAAGTLGLGALACLYWSGSKAGWLLAMILAVVLLVRSPLNRRLKIAVVAGLLVLGLAGFAAKFAGFFQRGATSVVARFDYWGAALQTAMAHPLVGTGPGTFSRPYQQIKQPESEMTRLTHNDYLQQASDAGWPAFGFYAAFVVGTLLVSGRHIWARGGWESFAVWLGTLGWALQGLVEFGLYIPALAWTAFALLGWLLALAANDSTTPAKAATLPDRT